MNLRYLSGMLSEAGNIKKINQDRVCVKKETMEKGDALLALVCDGMGGQARGDVAANTVVREFSIWWKNKLESVLEDPKRIENDWQEIIAELNERILGYSRQRNIKLGTTLTALFLMPSGEYFAANVGNSRIYSIRNKSIRQFFMDQEGMQKKKELFQIGTADIPEINYTMGTACRGDGFLLASDGFYHYFFAKELYGKMQDVRLCSDDEITGKLGKLFHEIIRCGEKDNISAVYVKVD